MKYENNLDQNEFYFEGFKTFKVSKLTDQINSFLFNCNSIDIKSHDDWIERYEKTFDLKLEKILANSIFINFILENKIFEKLEELTGFQYHIGDIVVRKTFSKKSYMPWHRDTYFYKKNAVGRTPPLIKLIYYPSFDSEKRIQLKIKRGSHLFFLKNKFIDKLINLIKPVKNIFASNNQVLLFNSALYHSVMPPSEKGEFRVIFNFCSVNQLNQFKNSKKISSALHH
tara:strand:- start:1861 stop:2541 length:681 start_codon:yes stop_codon:yes gene_type:complete